MTEHIHWDPDTYLDQIRREVPLFDELQDRAIAAVKGEPVRVLDLGIGTGETTRRVLERFPAAAVTGLDSSPAMCFRARELGIDVQLARMEDPLPDGPWDLVISVLAIEDLSGDQTRDLFRRVGEHAAQLVVAGAFAAADDVAAWCGGEIVWSGADLSVIRAAY